MPKRRRQCHNCASQSQKVHHKRTVKPKSFIAFVKHKNIRPPFPKKGTSAYQTLISEYHHWKQN